MNLTFLLDLNYVAIFVSSLIFFFLGSFWYSVLFKWLWVTELEHHNIIIAEPSKRDLFIKMVLTFMTNVIVCFALACLVTLVHSTTILQGAVLGLLAASIAGCAIAAVFIWENRSFNLFLIDAGYPFFGILIATILLSLWS